MSRLSPPEGGAASGPAEPVPRRPLGDDPIGNAVDHNKGLIRQTNEALILAAAERVFARTGFTGATMAAIADAAGLPKANLHYYFGSKADLYKAVLARTLRDWLLPLDALVPEADPAQALAAYIRAKMALSAARPDASKVFANELLHGAAVVGDLMRGELRARVRQKAAVLDGWIAAGRMAPVDSTHLFFTVWAATQTYADFDQQVCAVLDRPALDAGDHARATAHLVALLLRGCGLEQGGSAGAAAASPATPLDSHVSSK